MNRTFSLKQDISESLDRYVNTQRLKMGKLYVSHVVEDALKAFLKKEGFYDE